MNVVVPAVCFQMGAIWNDSREILPDVATKLSEYCDQGYFLLGLSSKAEDAGLDAICLGPPFPPDYFFFWVGRNRYREAQGIRSLHSGSSYGQLAALEVKVYDNCGAIIDWDESLIVGVLPEDEACARAASVRFCWAHEFFGRPAPSGVFRGEF